MRRIPFTLGAGVAAIDEMQRLDLVERSREMGAISARSSRRSRLSIPRLATFAASDSSAQSNSFATTRPRPRQQHADKVDGKPMVTEKVAAEMMKRGVTVQAWTSHFVIAPPLIIEKSEIDYGVNALDESLAVADEFVASLG